MNLNGEETSIKYIKGKFLGKVSLYINYITIDREASLNAMNLDIWILHLNKGVKSML